MLSTLDHTDADVLNAIQKIEVSQGLREKELALADLAAMPLGRKVIDWCYNPFITFGVTWKKEPVYRTDVSSDAHQLEEVFALLRRLASRDLTGKEATNEIGLHFAKLNPAAARILWLCLNKDLKAGVGTASIMAVDPKIVPFFAVMRAEVYEERHITRFPVVVEPKLDGNRVTFISRAGSGGFFTRTGKVIASLEHKVPVMLNLLRRWLDAIEGIDPETPVGVFRKSLSMNGHLPELVIDGEMMSPKGFDDVNGALNKKTDALGLEFHMFDCLTWEEFDAPGAVPVSWVNRRHRVNSIATAAAAFNLGDQVKQTEVTICHSHEEIQEVYQRHRMNNQEGAMVKDPAGFYEKRKCRGWLKLKNEDTEDLPVIGVYQGQANGKYAGTIGGLIVDRNGVEVRVSGIDDATREEIWSLWGETCNSVGVSADCGYEGRTFKFSSTPGILLGRLVEVEFHEVTKDGSLRHPRFIRFRDDKTGEIEK